MKSSNLLAVFLVLGISFSTASAAETMLAAKDPAQKVLKTISRNVPSTRTVALTSMALAIGAGCVWLWKNTKQTEPAIQESEPAITPFIIEPRNYFQSARFQVPESDKFNVVGVAIDANHGLE